MRPKTLWVVETKLPSDKRWSAAYGCGYSGRMVGEIYATKPDAVTHAGMRYAGTDYKWRVVKYERGRG